MTEGEDRKVDGRYLLKRQLGSGGMGRVWLAWDERLGRDVAVKEVLPRGPSVDGIAYPAVRRALREARAAANVRHRGVVTVHDTVDFDGRPWIIMEYIDGPSLADRLRDKGPLPVRLAAEITIEVIDALDAAHRQGVLHRDVKPGNIMLDKDRVVLTDFGIAVIEGTTRLTESGQLIGAPEYMSPERINCDEVTPAADLWAVGITLYHMVIGTTPFRRSDMLATYGAIATSDPDPHPGIGPLWPVIQGLLHKKPAQRLTGPAAITLLREALTKPVDQQFILPKAQLHHVHTETHDPATGLSAPLDPLAGPPMPPPPVHAPEPVAHPDDPAPGPVSADRPRLRTKIAISAGVAVAVLTVVATVVFTLGNHGADNGVTGTGTVQTQLPVFTSDPETLGFTIAAPQSYRRTASQVSDISSVTWQAAQPDPAIGPLSIQVTRDDTQPATKPIDYLSAKERAEHDDPDNIGYQRLSLTGQTDGSAVWEYTKRSAASGDYFHVEVLAVASGSHIFVLTFSLYAQDMPTLRTQWRATQPITTAIRGSFHVTL